MILDKVEGWEWDAVDRGGNGRGEGVGVGGERDGDGDGRSPDRRGLVWLRP